MTADQVPVIAMLLTVIAGYIWYRSRKSTRLVRWYLKSVEEKADAGEAVYRQQVDSAGKSPSVIGVAEARVAYAIPIAAGYLVTGYGKGMWASARSHIGSTVEEAGKIVAGEAIRAIRDRLSIEQITELKRGSTFVLSRVCEAEAEMPSAPSLLPEVFASVWLEAHRSSGLDEDDPQAERSALKYASFALRTMADSMRTF